MIKKFEEKMQKSIESLEREYNSIRAGRANPHVLDKIKVDYYGTPTPLQQVGNVSVPEPRIITIQPWETSLLKAIEKEIMQSDIGINPTNDGKVIRLVFPELTEERRKELVKDVKKKGEAAKVAIRNIRRDANDTLCLLYTSLNKQKERGVAVVCVAEDLDMLLEFCDRILVLCDGKVTGIVDARKTTKEEVGMLMTSHKEEK